MTFKSLFVGLIENLPRFMSMSDMTAPLRALFLSYARGVVALLLATKMALFCCHAKGWRGTARAGRGAPPRDGDGLMAFVTV